MRSGSSNRIALYLLVGFLIGVAFALVLFLGFPSAESETSMSVLSTASSETTESPVIGTVVSKIAPEIGAQAPDFALRDLGGNEIRLSDYRGRTVLLTFWATWCGPCRLEMPAFESRYQELKDDGFIVLGLNFDEPVEDVRAFRDELGLSFPLLLDPGGSVQRLYRIRGYPSSIFVDPQGVVRVVHIGLITEGQLRDYLVELGYNL
ncbi:MAG: TlpA family protein disulfide reductase [Anaerolineales bacterium]|nr:MAG: TlpA family protein disulfide reductase [Anaerolineales bacterium]